jgi:UDP-glucose 4-epimerase
MAVYLVTGGCGFIGSHLCTALIDRGDHVRILDNVSSGVAENAPMAAQVVYGSVTDPEAVDAAMAGVAGCFHLAAVASVERSMHDWVGIHRTNLTGTIAVFDAALRVGRRGPIPVVYASSAAVYGYGHELRVRESAPARPLSPYAADKYGCELHAHAAAVTHHLPTVGLRFFNVYGPRQNAGSSYSGVISIFFERLRRGQPIEIFGNGLQTRDFVFVTDAVTALLAAMDRANEGWRVFNVCSGVATTVLNLARLIAELCGCKPRICFRPPRPRDIGHSCGDRSLISEQLGLSDVIDLPSGLAATLAWLRASENPEMTQYLFPSPQSQRPGAI